jgi:large subunit ribosomal protein L10
MEKKRKIAEWKKKTVTDFVTLMKDYPIVGTVNMENLPAKQLQNMRQQLRAGVVMKMTKRRLINIALDQAKGYKKGIEKLKDSLPGMPALIFTKENPFALYKKVNKNKASAPAKGGQKAPKNIIVPAGPTSFSPGPIIGELGMLKIKTGIQDGKVAIKEDCIVVKEGDVIKPKVAELLTRLGIEPMEIGLDIVAIYEDGIIYKKDVLNVDEAKYVNDLKIMAFEAFNLAVYSVYLCDETTNVVLAKAHNDAVALSVSQSIVADGTVGILMGRAENQAEHIKKLSGL